MDRQTPISSTETDTTFSIAPEEQVRFDGVKDGGREDRVSKTTEMAGLAMRVLVADDYEPLRRFVSSTIAKLPQLKLVGEASDGLEALQKAQELQPEIILLDLNLPKLNGFEVARRIREHDPQSKIIFLSADRSFDIAEDALRMGAYGYLVKSDAGTQLAPTLEAALQGKQFVSSNLAGRVLGTLNQQPLETRALHRTAHERG